jgi:hypothetical protein
MNGNSILILRCGYFMKKIEKIIKITGVNKCTKHVSQVVTQLVLVVPLNTKMGEIINHAIAITKVIYETTYTRNFLLLNNLVRKKNINNT